MNARKVTILLAAFVFLLPLTESLSGASEKSREKPPPVSTSHFDISEIEKVMAQERYERANVLIVNKMNRRQLLSYAIFAAEQVLPIYEKRQSGDRAARNAIEEARAALESDTRKAREELVEVAREAGAATLSLVVEAAQRRGEAASLMKSDKPLEREAALWHARAAISASAARHAVTAAWQTAQTALSTSTWQTGDFSATAAATAVEAASPLPVWQEKPRLKARKAMWVKILKYGMGLGTSRAHFGESE